MNVRQPCVAGMFYEADKARLEKAIARMIPRGRKQKYDAVISPHAGYPYSGPTAALALSSLRPGYRFIILGPNHTGLGARVALDNSDAWETPLGRVRTDALIRNTLIAGRHAESDSLAHEREHSIEVQLPFLQHLFGSSIFITPVAIMGPGFSRGFLESLRALGSAIARAAKKRDARIVASSDFSHYISAASARERDMKAIEKIRSLDLDGFFSVLQETRASVCGYAPIAVMMSAAIELGWKRADLLGYTNSGEVTGDEDEVVAYAALGFR